MPIEVCVLGYGLSARTFHIPFILSMPGLALHSVIQRRSTSALEKHPDIKIFSSLELALANPDIQLVVLTSPNADHHTHATAALKAGKNVVVEKPFTTTSKQADELCALAKEAGRVLTVFHNRRWDSDFLTLKRILADKKLGRVVSVESRYDRYKAVPADPAEGRAWKLAQVPGNGTVWDLGSHLIDQILAQWGAPKKVWATIRDERNVSVDATAGFGKEGWTDDAFEAVLYYADGLLVKLGAATLALRPGGKQLRYHVRGTEGSWEKRGLDVQEDQVKAGMGPTDEGFGVEKKEDWGVLSTLEGDETTRAETGRYSEFYKNLVAMLEGREELAVKPHEARMVIKVIEAMGRSEREGVVVEL